MKKARKKQYKSKLPLNTKTLRFNLDQSFIAQHKRKLWYTPPLLIYKKKEVYGSLLLDESVGGNQLTLQFFTTAYELKRTDVLAYPQKPLAQQWHVEYPLLAYKTFTPDDREICIVNLAQDTPQKVINLDQWEFISFVTHTNLVNKKLFDERMETGTHIMVLVKRENAIRLISFRYDPWAADGQIEAAGSLELDVSQKKQKSDGTVLLFSGILAKPENLDETKRQLYARRFSSDKVRSVQLLSKSIDNVQHFVFVIQYNCSIIA